MVLHRQLKFTDKKPERDVQRNRVAAKHQGEASRRTNIWNIRRRKNEYKQQRSDFIAG